METSKSYVIIALIISLFTASVWCDRMTTKIYEYLNADSFCFRQMNATHQIGCSSSAAGNVGVVHVVETANDMNWILREGPDPPYIAVVNFHFFNLGNMTEFKSSERVTGVLVLQNNSTTIDEGYSPDRSCPNENFGLYSLHTQDKPEYASCAKGDWNPPNPAITMLFQDWGMPIFLVNKDDDIDSLVKGCYEGFNVPVNGTAPPWPLCFAELGSFMLAAKDSPTCIRRSNMNTNMNPVKLCDPLGSRNLITTLIPTSKEKTLQNHSVIVVAARLDAASMFDNIAPGADSAVTSLVTLLSVAHTLFQVKEQISTDKNVLFAIFNGESYDYIGSSRAVYDMELGQFPQKAKDDSQQPALIKLEHISHFIELHQVGPQKDNTKIWIHTDPISTQNPEVNMTVNKLVEFLAKFKRNYSLQRTDASYPLPPASVQRFLRKNLKIPSVVITNFDTEYTNKHFNSRFDLLNNLDDDWEGYLQELSTVVSKTVYKLLTEKEPTELVTNTTLIKQIMECYLTNAYCELFQMIASPSKVKQQTFNRTEPYSLYVSVDNQGSINPITIYTRYLLSFLTGEQLEGYVEENCTANSTDLVYHYDWMVGNLSNPGVCIRSTVEYTLAISPAAELNDWTSTEYSTWTESVWHTASLRIFLRPSRQLEGLTLGIGCIIFALSMLLVYSANKRADLLFGCRSLFAC